MAKNLFLLRCAEILDWYDFPRKFVAITDDGIRYLCVLYEQNPKDGYLRYGAVKTTSDLINEFKKGKRNLLSLFQEGSEFAEVVDTSAEYYIGMDVGREDIKDDKLPSEHYMFKHCNPMSVENWK